MSCTWVSNGIEAIITPVRPPITKMAKNPSTHSMGVAKRILAPHKEAIQQNICTPLGIAMVTLAAVKKLMPSCGSPVVNMWCTQRPKLTKPIDTTDSTSAV